MSNSTAGTMRLEANLPGHLSRDHVTSGKSAGASARNLVNLQTRSFSTKCSKLHLWQLYGSIFGTIYEIIASEMCMTLA